MIVKPEEFDKYKKEIGAKALRLKELKDFGLNVPDFLVISSGFLMENINDSGCIKNDKLKSLVDYLFNVL